MPDNYSILGRQQERSSSFKLLPASFLSAW
jgi:hypothetical protein